MRNGKGIKLPLSSPCPGHQSRHGNKVSFWQIECFKSPDAATWVMLWVRCGAPVLAMWPPCRCARESHHSPVSVAAIKAYKIAVPFGRRYAPGEPRCNGVGVDPGEVPRLRARCGAAEDWRENQVALFSVSVIGAGMKYCLASRVVQESLGATNGVLFWVSAALVCSHGGAVPMGGEDQIRYSPVPVSAIKAAVANLCLANRMLQKSPDVAI